MASKKTKSVSVYAHEHEKLTKQSRGKDGKTVAEQIKVLLSEKQHGKASENQAALLKEISELKKANEGLEKQLHKLQTDSEKQLAAIPEYESLFEQLKPLISDAKSRGVGPGDYYKKLSSGVSSEDLLIVIKEKKLLSDIRETCTKMIENGLTLSDETFMTELLKIYNQ